MVRTLERLGDRMLAVAVPRINASADPCVGCRPGESFNSMCYCHCGGSASGVEARRTCRCDGCHWICTACRDTLRVCWC